MNAANLLSTQARLYQEEIRSNETKPLSDRCLRHSPDMESHLFPLPQNTKRSGLKSRTQRRYSVLCTLYLDDRDLDRLRHSWKHCICNYATEKTRATNWRIISDAPEGSLQQFHLVSVTSRPALSANKQTSVSSQFPRKKTGCFLARARHMWDEFNPSMTTNACLVATDPATESECL
ncbi:hypothetical protein ASPZODRAFT_1963883 [Penicilliopsis zonata CBS 506.65]|uniref:Uncharacterized protein n=1 Tax=Penicilliopsis zonata CBS 506.65 TaxID=1073090 RepID=A0A1L9SH09_9EURO|nr:hypothetical protein ASPZODRAFT_1963883 [Penicilliopsis zonata CBS 506.65]OJJ46479.1 hypothetical protein ASPZODRAFT_1963883 [Penicilliopsis zonata CBS 506.65]